MFMGVYSFERMRTACIPGAHGGLEVGTQSSGAVIDSYELPGRCWKLRPGLL